MQQNFLFKPTTKALKTFKIFDSTLPTSWEQTGADHGNLAHFCTIFLSLQIEKELVILTNF